MSEALHAQPKAPILVSFATQEDLKECLAAFIVKAQNESITKKNHFTIALSGGSLPKLLDGLRDPVLASNVKWSSWRVFYVDERVVPDNHQDSDERVVPANHQDSDERVVPANHQYSNHKSCMENLFAKVEIPAENIHPVDTTLCDLEEIAYAYEQQLIQEFAPKDAARFPVFDLILLGMGPDGHTASLFPNHKLLSEGERWVAYVEDSPKPPSKRITFTCPVINHAVRVVFVAVGKEKADALASVLDNPELGLPSALIKPVSPGQLYWFVDEVAAATTNYPRTDSKFFENTL